MPGKRSGNPPLGQSASWTTFVRMAAELLIPVVAFGASLLTFLSGFGLGTLLLPAFAVFFPLELAVVMTAFVHLLNNVFKYATLWRHVNKRIVLLFGLPGMLGSWLGAQQLLHWSDAPALYEGVRYPVDATRLVIGVLMALFALLEAIPTASQWSVPARFVPAGGLVSGFFGGLSGHQGALRSIFLLRYGLGKEVFIATGVAIALLVDLTRIPLYIGRMDLVPWREHGLLLIGCVLAAFGGAWLGKRWLPKVTLRAVQLTVAGLLFAISASVIAGLI